MTTRSRETTAVKGSTPGVRQGGTPAALVLGLAPALGPRCSRGAKVANLGPDGGGNGPANPPGERCGNGIDDDGDGQIDEGCACTPGESQRCYSGGYASRGVGTC